MIILTNNQIIVLGCFGLNVLGPLSTHREFEAF